MPEYVQLGSRRVGAGEPCLIVAEIGANHNGDLPTALEMVCRAKEAGADVVKFQKRTLELCIPPGQRDQVRVTPWGPLPYWEYRSRLEFREDDYAAIHQFCRERAISWTASVWDEPSLAFLLRYDPPWIKIPSACLTDIPLLEACRRAGRPVVASTGMSTEQQILRAVQALGPDRLVLLHCTSTYPCVKEELNLSCIAALRQRFAVPVGYCLDPSVRILTSDLRWVKAEAIQPGTEIIGFDEKLGVSNRYCRSIVLGAEHVRLPRVSIGTTKGTIIVSEDHLFPALRPTGVWEERRRQWRRAVDLKPGDTLTHLVAPWDPLTTYEAGWLAGVLDGEGWVRPRCVGFAQNAGPILDRYESLIASLGFTSYARRLRKTRSCQSVDVYGRRESMRLLGMIRPVRLLNNAHKIWEGLRTWHQHSVARIENVERLAPGDLIAVTTSTGTLVADGFLSHNSGHHQGIWDGLCAAVLGACVVEKHFTLDRASFGTDQAASLEPAGLARMVRYIRNWEIARGDGVKRVYESELPILAKLRRVP